MKKHRTEENAGIVKILIIVLLCILTAALGVYAFMKSGGSLSLPKSEKKTESISQAAAISATADLNPGAEGDSETDGTDTGARATLPTEVRAVTLRAGEDFAVSGDEAAIKAQIDDALSATDDMQVMNTVVIDPMSSDGTVIYDSGIFGLRGEEFDSLSYIISAAREKGYSVLVNYYLTDTVADDEPTTQGTVDADTIDAVRADAAAFASKYSPDAVLIDGYYNVTAKTAYATYLRLGGAQGYTEYEYSIANALLETAKDAFSQTNPAILFGLRVEASWANDYEDERGSATKALFSAYIEGNTDTLSILGSGIADLIAVKAYGSATDGNIPFNTVAAWWDGIAEEYDLPLYITHAASRAITSAAGWGEYDQLARQVIDARTLSSYAGSIFNSLTRMRENPEEFATKLIGYYEGTVREEHILQDLELTKPSSTRFTTYDPTVVFAGNTDPNTTATINGTVIDVDQNGYFQLEMSLSEGDNVFSIVHKGKTITYTITRVTEVVKEISPASGTLSVDGSTKLTVTAVAYEEATVTATIGSQTITLSHASSEDDEYRDTAYARFSGVFTVPDATTAVQNLGALTVTGTWNGITKTKTGATICVNEKVLPSDGQPVVVTATLAETFSSGTISQYSEPDCLPLPKGSLDYAIGDAIAYNVTENGKARTYTFYRLQSGIRVLADDIAAVGTAQAPANNHITGCTVTSDSDSTRVILATEQQVAYTAKYSSSKITVQFHYTSSLPDSMTLTKNPLFSAATFSGDTLTLTLRTQGRFYGYNAYYDTNGNLVLEFRNPPDVSGHNLSGASIVIDPGHGSGDTGALGFLSSYPENVINYGIASALADILEGWGADVTLIPSNRSYYSLSERVAAAEAADPDLFISVHNNSSSTSSSATGSEAYYFNPWSAGLAKYAAANLADALGTTNRGGKFGYYYVTRTMQYPAILIEGGFVSNQTEYHKLIDDDYQEEMAEGLAEAIVSYFSSMGAGTTITGTQSSGSSVTAGDKSASVASSAAAGEDTESSSTSTAASTSESGLLTLSDSEIELSVGETYDITAAWGGSGTATLEWRVKSSGEDIVGISANGAVGTVTALKAGTATIRVRANSDTDTMCECKVTVTE